jgi:hypothetical protein
MSNESKKIHIILLCFWLPTGMLYNNLANFFSDFFFHNYDSRKPPKPPIIHKIFHFQVQNWHLIYFHTAMIYFIISYKRSFSKGSGPMLYWYVLCLHSGLVLLVCPIPLLGWVGRGLGRENCWRVRNLPDMSKFHTRNTLVLGMSISIFKLTY